MTLALIYLAVKLERRHTKAGPSPPQIRYIITFQKRKVKVKVIPNIHSSEFPAAVIFCVNCKLIETRGEEAELKTLTLASQS